MDKVDFSRNFDNSQNPAAFLNAQAMADSRKARSKKNAPLKFSNVLETSFLETGELGPLADIPPSEEALQELLDNVRSSGDDLRNRPFPEEILKYKQAVRNFLNYSVKNGYELVELQGSKKKAFSGGKPEWRAAVYRQIRVVDQKLDQLAAEILTKHIKELDLKSKLSEITGLLVNLTITGKIKERDE
ncbi:MAG: DUF327 family protein [Treponema sp.]|jgi:uncharacterized protein YaaR (DUF327 family)|nr:DUF327 family protein [Treponema sp.]